MDTKDPNYQKRDAAKRAADRAARAAARAAGARAVNPNDIARSRAEEPKAPAHEWNVPVTVPKGKK